ncbi:1-phosphofructokinase family hexose kinase [Frigidibacter sp. ROC022]|uniref:1-phosphofructokinase family hexose kinase n=1 Tax=Frigidibacter sp. ROC022 TaxID=2971796 RepID=UPI00215ACF21|nr:1-phosphofructokinase family hexose kinase [Frigidibacter sp. ROC022]MCR8722672.1 1-phosphofructokinase family hexose kinase [Frigidibacter sp. ROC022]
MPTILTVTLNPALDLSTETESIRPGPKLRCAAPRVDPGGGGVNVSRALRNLGGDSRALVALGGACGMRMAALLAEEGITVLPLDAPGETRESLAVTETASGAQYRFVMPGPAWAGTDLARALDRIVAEAAADSLVVLSGSLPPGVPEDLAALLAARLAPTGARLLVDTSGAPLRRLAAEPAGLFLLRMDGAEATELAGAPLPDLAATAGYARSLVARGVARVVVLARGAEGNVLAAEDGAWAARCPKREVTSAVGAGDSFVAGLTLALARGETLPEALRHGAAAASAAVLTPATDLCRAEDHAAILPLTELLAL